MGSGTHSVSRVGGHAVVLGAGIAGLFAARVLSEFYDSVSVVERDRLADYPTDRKGVPVLLKQYLKLGGELVAFHVDRRFADALDGLIVVDLRKTDARVLERYMGKDGAAQFLNQ